MENGKWKMENEGQEQEHEARAEAGTAAEEDIVIEDAEEEGADDVRHRDKKGKDGEAAPEPTAEEISQAVIAGLTDRLARTLAEFDNFRKRTAKEKTAMYDNGVRDAIGRFLPVADNLERALASVAEADRDTPIYKGVEMIYRQAGQILADMGLEPLPGEGEPFDHNFHHAVASEDGEGEREGEPIVAEVLQKGYKYRDKVVRPSMVRVKK